MLVTYFKPAKPRSELHVRLNLYESRLVHLGTSTNALHKNNENAVVEQTTAVLYVMCTRPLTRAIWLFKAYQSLAES